MGTRRTPAAPPNAHITDYQQLPAYEEILSIGGDSLVQEEHARKLVIPQEKVHELMALGLPNQRFFVLSSEAELRSPMWYFLINKGKSMGLSFVGHATAGPDIFQLLNHQYGQRRSSRAAKDDARVIQRMVDNSSPLEWFRSIVQRCVDAGASDMHLELRDTVATLRVRLDGIMRHLGSFPVQMALEGVSAAYTVLAEERSRTEVAFNASMAQAAMIPLKLPQQNLTLRYQSHPAVGGLDVVIRILKSASAGAQTRLLTLERLGFTPWQMGQLENALASAWGGVFIAGVTGSGKTTTLNTLMASLTRNATRKLITIEDPVEYELSGVTHMSIQRKAENTAEDPFHAAMLAFLRMDPDVGLFGEIRDQVSARMAQAAIQTGHKILSTVHATSSLGIISRLSSEGLGLKRQDLCSPEFISALVYQVLMPVNCEHCKRLATEVMKPQDLQLYAAAFGLNPDTLFCASDTGCSHCQKPGIDYSIGERNGTLGVKVGAEVLVPDTHMLELLLAGRDMEARRYWHSRQSDSFASPDMNGKEAWGHVLFDVAEGRVDPYYFERTFGSAAMLARSLQRGSY